MRALAPIRIGAVRCEAPFSEPILQETTVASTCDICAKGPSFGKSVSHSHRRTSRRWNPNIQTVRATVNGTSKRLNVCTSCLKAGKVQQLSA